jgi:hypothetical protein
MDEPWIERTTVMNHVIETVHPDFWMLLFDSQVVHSKRKQVSSKQEVT